MESKRQQKFSRLIQKEISTVFQRDLPEVLKGAFVTVTVVRTSPDLTFCKIYLSILGYSNQDELVKSLNEDTSQLRYALGKRISNQRVIPSFQFYLDDTAEEAAKMDNLFRGLDIPTEEGDEDQ